MNKKITFFRRRFRLTNFLAFMVIFLIGMILFRRIAVFFIISLVVAVSTYFIYSVKLPFDLSPVLFVSLIISRQYSVMPAAVFIAISGIIPMILAGGSFDHTTLFYVSVRILVNFINTFLKPFPIVPVLIGMSFLDHLLGTVGSVSLFGANPAKEMTNIVLQTSVDIIYILSLSSLLVLMTG
ncbi:MAG: hypothetical protein HGA85_06890 [Nanoarchaeota archaeon]|nr:hypothetical protein [Nanoarchaeota archaeon]